MQPQEAAGAEDKEVTRKGPADLEGRAGRALSACEPSHRGERPEAERVPPRGSAREGSLRLEQ